MTQRHSPDASACDIPALEAEIAAFKKEKAECVARERELRGREDVEAGLCFAAEIFALQQDKLRIEVEIDIRRKKIRRRQLGWSDEPAGPPPSGGFVF